jgi:hypothetical protein
MVTYIKNISFDSPNKSFLETTLSNFNIKKIDQEVLDIKTYQIGEYFEKMPNDELSISISSANLSYISRELGACEDNKIWVYFPNSKDYINSDYKPIITFEKWRNTISKNLLFHELIEYVSKGKTHKDYEKEHEFTDLNKNCTSTVNIMPYSTFTEKLDYAYNLQLCIPCEKKIIKGLNKVKAML